MSKNPTIKQYSHAANIGGYYVQVGRKRARTLMNLSMVYRSSLEGRDHRLPRMGYELILELDSLYVMPPSIPPRVMLVNVSGTFELRGSDRDILADCICAIRDDENARRRITRRINKQARS